MRVGEKLIIFALLLSSSAFASVDLKEGWHWYPPKLEPVEPKKESLPEQPQIQKAEVITDPLVELELIQKTLKQKRAQAVLYPSKGNIADYLYYQKKVVNKASLFSDQFRRLVWSDPELDYTLVRPVSSLAKSSWLEDRKNQEAQAIKELSQTYGVFFFFRSDCPYCHKFAPVLKQFALKHGLEVIPISLDGGALSEYPHPQLDTGQFAQLSPGKTVVPAIIAIDPERGKVVPINYGFVSESELAQRILVLTQYEAGHDY